MAVLKISETKRKEKRYELTCGRQLETLIVILNHSLMINLFIFNAVILIDFFTIQF